VRPRYVSEFLLWAARRLIGLASNGIGITSTLVSVALFVVPSFAPGWSRWYAVAPIAVYVVAALLWDEYVRNRGACLTAALVSKKEEKWKRNWLEIQNCGAVVVRDVDWDLMGEPRGWTLDDEGIRHPLPELEAGEKINLPVYLDMGCDTQVTVRLRGVAGGRDYQRDKLVTVYG
jgi:hypothetical protein